MVLSSPPMSRYDMLATMFVFAPSLLHRESMRMIGRRADVRHIELDISRGGQPYAPGLCQSAS
eukprot:scaffold82253_cov31-Prasinocladus_malaysianus.AAC.1